MTVPLNVLIVEDSKADGELLAHELRNAGFEPTWKRVETEADYCAGLDLHPDIIFSDFSLPQFSTLRALELLKNHGLDIPFIIVSGTIGEERAVENMKGGATDYVLKDHIKRIGPGVRRALKDHATARSAGATFAPRSSIARRSFAGDDSATSI